MATKRPGNELEREPSPAPKKKRRVKDLDTIRRDMVKGILSTLKRSHPSVYRALVLIAHHVCESEHKIVVLLCNAEPCYVELLAKIFDVKVHQLDGGRSQIIWRAHEDDKDDYIFSSVAIPKIHFHDEGEPATDDTETWAVTHAVDLGECFDTQKKIWDDFEDHLEELVRIVGRDFGRDLLLDIVTSRPLPAQDTVLKAVIRAENDVVAHYIDEELVRTADQGDRISFEKLATHIGAWRNKFGFDYCWSRHTAETLRKYFADAERRIRYPSDETGLVGFRIDYRFERFCDEMVEFTGDGGGGYSFSPYYAFISWFRDRYYSLGDDDESPSKEDVVAMIKTMARRKGKVVIEIEGSLIGLRIKKSADDPTKKIASAPPVEE